MELREIQDARCGHASTYNGDVCQLLEEYIAPFAQLKTKHAGRAFEQSVEEADAAIDERTAHDLSRHASRALVFGIALAILLARSIVRPLRNAVAVAEPSGDGHLDNVIETGGSDETGQLLEFARRHADRAARARREGRGFRGQIAAIGRSQAVIEFDMDGTVREVNENFARVMGYSRAEVIGKHHSMFVEPSFAAKRRVPRFWEKLKRGESDDRQLQAHRQGRPGSLDPGFVQPDRRTSTASRSRSSSTPPTSPSRKLRDGGFRGSARGHRQGAGRHRVRPRRHGPHGQRQLRAASLGYSDDEVRGKHHSMFVDPAITRRAEYRAFWAKLARGEAVRHAVKRIAKGGREVGCRPRTTRSTMPTASRSRWSSTRPT